MKFNIKERINWFLNNSKDYPLLTGFSVGFYALVFYFSNNFDLVNSWSQLFFFLFYFIVSSIAIVFITFKAFQISKYSRFARQSVLILMLLLLFVYVFGISNVLGSYKKIGLIFFLILVIIKLKIRNHKYLVLFLFLMSAIPTYKLGKIIGLNFMNTAQWQQQPDDILNCKFKKRPNIYYIQPDGYASDINLKGPLYRYDNSKFDNWLKAEGFTLYNDYRSNYESTLFSNSSCFYMKHHFSNEFSRFNYARDYIVGDNPVLKIFKNNKYKTFFITESPYLLMNRPEVFYDYCNFSTKELPFLKDGMTSIKNLTFEIKNQIAINKNTNNFFFIEKFKPSHIIAYEGWSKGVESERINYIKNVELANDWLKEIVLFIKNSDPTGIIIIGADHGGFVGFESTSQAQNKITNSQLLYSIFGAKLAIKWNDPKHEAYDANLKTPVNLFRVIFSYLSENKGLLKNLQPNTSYNCYDPSDFSKVYMAIDEKGSSEFLNKK